MIHDHEPGSNIKYITPWKTAAKDIFLHVPALNEQRFRAPDIVWNSWMVNGVKKWGFIVLISSANPALPRKERYKFQWLLRFDGNGNPYGEPIDIASLVPKDFKTTNWEGLDWYEEGKKLILVYDDKKEKLPNPLVVDVSKHWDMNEIPSQKILRPDADSCK